MDESSARWETIEHTADLAIEVRAPSLESLFLTAADGLTGLLQGRESGPADAGAAERWRELELEAADTATLLVEWLRELLYIHASDELVFAAGGISELDDGRLVARVGLRRPAPETIERELKGVTYHDLEVCRENDGWFGRIVFDV